MLAAHVDCHCRQESGNGALTADLCAVSTACMRGRNYVTSTTAPEVDIVRHSSATVCLVLNNTIKSSINGPHSTTTHYLCHQCRSGYLFKPSSFITVQ